ncbi:28S ribosomal protein S23, mitochondrial-like isoform X2 [Centruroides sculpturatus]|uniref:28S ribosomal protein S23, mitochondrial-like isoform X2 n=2 Tax=Centruroides sculpturatus TaxID=218467 RepID=UPI000C6C90C4|nr:28S ribosomal protein S23, mitochondrial-like isoform X2 [Centruroides sculpturatus]XP_023238083.1 28S ribosomal protein S23, mitochondrial-like isoform X2 [Centruroides sculpturatus]XP_023238084.1 28S ribosomal protein S23, mitochondrial-like isoform X2 [Centruroides sculpturatus]
MAGSRLEKLGTIFSRMTGLLRSGALKKEDKPTWYDIYKAFPPLIEPIFKREVSEKEITQIFYPEDVYRAKFYRKYGSDIIDMADTSPTLSEQ